MKNFLLIFFVLLGTGSMFAQTTLSAPGSPFQQGSTITFNYSGGTGSDKDWIGIYNPGDVPGNQTGQVASIVWHYVPTINEGTLDFDGTLPNGDYEVHYFCCDGYEIKATTTISVTGATPSSIKVDGYAIHTQPMTFKFAGGTGSLTDWVGIYQVGEIPGSGPTSIVYQYVPMSDGSITFNDTLPVGDYDVFFLCCDTYNSLAKATFHVYEDLDPSLAPAATPTVGQPLTFDFTGGTGSDLDWVGIYDHDSIPGSGPLSISYLYIPAPNGSVTFDDISGLVPGKFYDAHMLCCDGYQILSSYTNWTVTVVATNDPSKAKIELFRATPTLAQEVVHLTFPAPLKGEIKVFNLTGQAIRHISVNGESNLELRDLPTGAYSVQFQGEKGTQAVKIVVAR